MRTQRRSIRLPGFDYAQAGLYFVTLCCHDRQHRFGLVSDGVMQPNEFGRLADDLWYQCLDRFQLPNQHPMQIMPNHLHGIIELPIGATLVVAQYNAVSNRAGASPAPTICNAVANRSRIVGATLAVARNDAIANRTSPAPTLGDVVGTYKSLVAKACLDICRDRRETLGKFWQRNYYEHIIRDASSYSHICAYIESNPMRWQMDEYFNLARASFCASAVS